MLSTAVVDAIAGVSEKELCHSVDGQALHCELQVAILLQQTILLELFGDGFAAIEARGHLY